MSDGKVISIDTAVKTKMQRFEKGLQEMEDLLNANNKTTLRKFKTLASELSDQIHEQNAYTTELEERIDMLEEKMSLLLMLFKVREIDIAGDR